MNASEGLKSTAALAPSSAIRFPKSWIVVRPLFSFKASASAWRAGQAVHMHASETLESTAAWAPSGPISLWSRSIVVRLLFCFKASASAWPRWAGRPHECKRGSQEHRSLGTIGTDAIAEEINRGEAAVLLQSLCQCLEGRAGRPHGCKRGSQKHGSLGTIITDAIPAEVNRGEAAALLQRLGQRLGERQNSTAGQVASFPDSATLKAELVGASATALPSEPFESLIWMSSKVFSEATACQNGAWGWKEIR